MTADDALEKQLQDAGLYDPSRPDAAERLEAFRYLLGNGVTVDEVRGVYREDSLELAAVDRLIKGGKERLTLAEAAERANVSRDLALRLWLADGFPDPGDAPIFTEDDWHFPLFALAAEKLGEDTTLQVTRVIGSAMARIAEAEVAAFAQNVAEPMLDDRLALMKTSVELMSALPGIATVMDRIHRHHLESAIRRLIFATEGFTGTVDRAPMAIGFADLTGYTALSQRLTHEELARALASFEAAAHNEVVERGGRVVKLIGDEVMFAATHVHEACDIALALAGRVSANPSLPDLRTGIAFGGVLVRDGDYYGPVVNLASRAAAVAAPGQTLVTADVAREDGSVHRFESVGKHALKGFDEEIELLELSTKP